MRKELKPARGNEREEEEGFRLHKRERKGKEGIAQTGRQKGAAKGAGYSNRGEGLDARGKEGGKRGRRTHEGRKGARGGEKDERRAAKRKGATTTTTTTTTRRRRRKKRRIGERGREGSRRLMRHAHVGTCLRPHPRSPRTPINNPSTPARSENCR